MPATVLKDPLGVAAVFSDGTSVSMMVNVTAGGKTYSTRNPALAQDMLLGLADLVRPHGDIDAKRTLNDYTAAIRALTNDLADQGFTGGATELTRAHLAQHWLRGSHRAALESLSRRMLARADDLHGLLKADVREMVDGRHFQIQRQSENTLAPYTESEWARLTRACETVVTDSYSAYGRARRAAEDGQDPLKGGWSEANVYWAYAQFGPVEATPYADWSPGHFSGLPERQFPYRKVAVSALLFPDASTALAYRLLLGIYTGIVPDGLDDLGLGDVDWAGESTVLLSYIKGRTAEESRTLTKRASRLLEQWLDHSSLTRRFAPAHMRDALWVRYVPRGVHHWVTTATSNETSQKWILSQGLLADGGGPLQLHLHRIRTTYDSMRDRRSWAGSRRATLDPNRSPQVEADHYLGAGTPEQQALVEEIIVEAQNDMLRKAEPPMVLATEDAATLVRDYPEQVAALGLDDTALADLVHGERDVFSAACGDYLSGLHGPKGKPCPARPWVCLLCPLALFTPRHLPNLMRLRAFFARQWDQRTAEEFMRNFGPHDQRVAEILAPDVYFPSATLLEAAAQVADSDDELPLRPEETTR
ncbi:hypothetical protein ABZ027_36705 [Streptomyces sp. NPDC006332]|uniref:hypothetical protein n=1 Tax=Streptomyces sp. NPDC006332 TaxID=3155456 RepID=UPI0033B64B03